MLRHWGKAQLLKNRDYTHNHLEARNPIAEQIEQAHGSWRQSPACGEGTIRISANRLARFFAKVSWVLHPSMSPQAENSMQSSSLTTTTLQLRIGRAPV